MKITTQEELAEAAGRLIQQGLSQVVVSLGKEGVYYQDREGRCLWARGEPMEVVNATGAGDAFMGGLVYAHLQGWPPEKTLPFAVAASRMAIAHQNTINPNISAENILAVVEGEHIAVREPALCL